MRTTLAEYLPLHRCIDGFCMLSERLFCTTLKRVPMAPGETWAPDVQKLEACHSTEGVLGHLYLDLNQREGAHWLLRSCPASHLSSALLGETADSSSGLVRPSSECTHRFIPLPAVGASSQGSFILVFQPPARDFV
jgi:hypothetical protein